jgi:hypothetical protein
MVSNPHDQIGRLLDVVRGRSKTGAVRTSETVVDPDEQTARLTGVDRLRRSRACTDLSARLSAPVDGPASGAVRLGGMIQSRKCR